MFPVVLAELHPPQAMMSTHVDAGLFSLRLNLPHAYRTGTQLDALAARTGRNVEPVGVLSAGMLNALGTNCPVEVARTAELLGSGVSDVGDRGFQIPPEAWVDAGGLNAIG